MTDNPFDARLAQWRAWADAPWGRIRFAVAQHVLALHARELGPRLRILDVGGGDGRDALP